MSSFSDYLEEAILNHVFRGVEYTPPASIWLALSTTEVQDDGTGLNEPGYTGYERQEITLGEPEDNAEGAKEMALASEANFGDPDQDGTVTHFAVMDAQSGGNVLGPGEMDAPINYQAAVEEAIKFAPGSIAISLD